MYIVSVEVDNNVAESLLGIMGKIRDDASFGALLVARVCALEHSLSRDDPAGIPLCLGMAVLLSNERQISINEVEL